MGRKKTFVILKNDLDGLEILALLLEMEANNTEKQHGDSPASDMTRMSVGEITIAQALRGFADFLRVVAQRIRK